MSLRKDVWALDAGVQPEAAALYRQACAQVFDVTLDVADADFHNRLEGYNLGVVLFARCQGVAQRFQRRTVHIRADPADNVQAILYVNGAEWRGDFDGRVVSSGMGPLRLIDMARPFEVQSAAFETLNLMLPRRLLGAAGQRDFHGLVLSEAEAAGRLLMSHLRALWDAAEAMTASEAEAAGQAAALLVAGAITAHAPDRPAPARASDLTLLAEGRAYVDRRIYDADLTPEAVRGHLNISRSALYKAFEPVGGVGALILSRRLDHAFDAILADEETTVGEIGYRHGFRSNAHFGRVFRARFGLAPGALRRLRSQAQGGKLSAIDRPEDVFAWLKSL